MVKNGSISLSSSSSSSKQLYHTYKRHGSSSSRKRSSGYKDSKNEKIKKFISITEKTKCDFQQHDNIHRESEEKKSCSTPQSKTCPLCENRETFQFTPKYPQELMVIVEELGIDHNQTSILSCPFCSRRPKRRQNTVEESDSPLQVKSEDVIQEVSYASFSAEQLEQVSILLAADLILSKGYPPVIALQALLNVGSMNPVSAANEALKLLTSQLESASLMMMQTRSEESNRQAKDQRRQEFLVEVISGVESLQLFSELFPDISPRLSNLGDFWESFLQPFGLFSDLAALKESPSVCICGQWCEEDLLGATRSLTQLLIIGATRRRQQVYRILNYLNDGVKWYKEPARRYKESVQNEMESRVVYLQRCLDKTPDRLPDNVAALAAEHDQGGIEEEHVLAWLCAVSDGTHYQRLRTLEVCCLLLESWLIAEIEKYENEALMPNFNNLLSIPSLFLYPRTQTFNTHIDVFELSDPVQITKKKQRTGPFDYLEYKQEAANLSTMTGATVSDITPSSSSAVSPFIIQSYQFRAQNIEREESLSPTRKDDACFNPDVSESINVGAIRNICVSDNQSADYNSQELPLGAYRSCCRNMILSLTKKNWTAVATVATASRQLFDNDCSSSPPYSQAAQTESEDLIHANFANTEDDDDVVVACDVANSRVLDSHSSTALSLFD